MPMWRCPHCGTPQAETARCWVCRRSSTACATCRHFRRSVAGHLGYCGLDPQRRPLNGDEIRGCWEAAVASPEAPEPARSRPRSSTVSLDLDRTAVRRLEFVEVGATLDDEPEHRLRRRKPATAAPVQPSPRPGRDAADVPGHPVVALASSGPTVPERIRPQQGSTEPRWSLWSDGEL